jgi:alpha-galactosidase
MIKVAMIGAGSVVFARNLTGDLLSFPEFRDGAIAYMDVDADRLDVAARLGRKVADALGARPRIEATVDRRAALDGADFVINMVQVGGFDSTLVDFEIPRKYGLNFTIADTTGPGGMFRALRTFPVLTGLCRDIEEVCPRAILLNYSNPMSMNMRAVAATSCVRAVGLCHSVQGTLAELMGYVGEDPAAVSFVCAGINHMAFYLRLERDGADLYPRLFEAMARADVYDSNRVRFELMRRLGYFVTESSEHNAEYSPFFLAHGREHAARFAVPVDEYLRRCDAIVGEFERLRAFARSDEAIREVRKSREYGSAIVHGVATGRPAVVYANVPNRGSISNLPESAIVEVATVVDRAGCRPTVVGELPPQLVAYMMPHVMQHELFVRAAVEGRRDHVYHAAMTDPLTASRLTADRIVQMCDELIAAHGFVDEGGVLPRLDRTPTRVPTCGHTFARVDPRALRASWQATRDRSAAATFVESWHVIGPFVSPRAGEVSLDLATPVEAEFAGRADGAVNLKATYPRPEGANGDATGEGGPLEWEKVFASTKNGAVNLTAELGPHEWAVAYGYAEVESEIERETVLRCGSDDGIRIWLNGEQVHTHEARRPYHPHSDTVPVRLRAGVNRLLVKVDNAKYDWSFGVAVDSP